MIVLRGSHQLEGPSSQANNGLGAKQLPGRRNWNIILANMGTMDMFTGGHEGRGNIHPVINNHPGGRTNFSDRPSHRLGQVIKIGGRDGFGTHLNNARPAARSCPRQRNHLGRWGLGRDTITAVIYRSWAVHWAASAARYTCEPRARNSSDFWSMSSWAWCCGKDGKPSAAVAAAVPKSLSKASPKVSRIS